MAAISSTRLGVVCNSCNSSQEKSKGWKSHMFLHIVLMSVKSETEDSFYEKVEDYAHRVRTELAYVRKYSFTRNLASRARGYDWAVYGLFDSADDHEKYQMSSVHQEMKAFIASVVDDMVVCDAEWM